jgi:CRP-like cAMP-binding protein
MSFLSELTKDDSFGEISFFSDLPRQATIKSSDYTDVLTISKYDFFALATNDHLALVFLKYILIFLENIL